MYIVFFSKAPKKKGGKKAKGGKAAAVVDAIPPEDMNKDQVRTHSISPRALCPRASHGQRAPGERRLPFVRIIGCTKCTRFGSTHGDGRW